MPMPMGGRDDDAVAEDRELSFEHHFRNLKAIFATLQAENATLQEASALGGYRSSRLPIRNQSKGPGATLAPSCPRPVVATSRSLAESNAFEQGSDLQPSAAAKCADDCPMILHDLVAEFPMADGFSGFLEASEADMTRVASPTSESKKSEDLSGGWSQQDELHSNTFSPCRGVAQKIVPDREQSAISAQGSKSRLSERRTARLSLSMGSIGSISRSLGVRPEGRSRKSAVTSRSSRSDQSSSPSSNTRLTSRRFSNASSNRLNLQEVDRIAQDAALASSSCAHFDGPPHDSPGERCWNPESTAFELVFCFVICSNILLMGLETDYRARHLGGDMPVAFTVTQYVYFLVFLIELLIRFHSAGGLRLYWNGPDKKWKLIDVTSVTFAAAEALVSTIQLAVGDDGSMTDASTSLSFLQLVRLVRLLRIFRLVRVMRFLVALKTLCYSIFGTLKALCWALVLLFLIIYGFALVFTHASASAREDALRSDGNPTFNTDLKNYFGNVGSSMQTLFMSISGGVSWEIAYTALLDVGIVWAYGYNAFVTFTYLCVLNVLTANFCQTAIEHAQSDQDSIVKGVIAQKAAYKQLLRRLYEQIDTNCSGSVSLKELTEHFKEEAVQAYLYSLDLEPADAWTLFKLLDEDGGEHIDEDEFVEGCMRLRGHAKAIEVATLMTEHKWLTFELSDFMNTVEDALAVLCGTDPETRVRKNEAARRPHTLSSLDRDMFERTRSFR